MRARRVQIDVPLLTLLLESHIPVPLALSPLCSEAPPLFDLTSTIGAASAAGEPAPSTGEPFVKSSPRRLSSSGAASEAEAPNPLLRLVKKTVYGIGGALRLDPWDVVMDGTEEAAKNGNKGGDGGAAKPPSGLIAEASTSVAPCSVLLKLVTGYPRRKRLFLVRHGESEWNKAQASLNALGMYAQVTRSRRRRVTRTATHLTPELAPHQTRPF